MGNFNKTDRGELAENTIDKWGDERYNPDPMEGNENWKNFLEAVSMVLMNYKHLEEKGNE